MNFSYSGQIISLAQYFDRKHSIATSLAMVGIGLGMLLMGPWIEYNIQEYGWRGSFIWNAGISLNIAVFSILIFPLRGLGKVGQEEKDEEKTEDDQQPQSSTVRGIPTSRSRYLFEKSLNDRSFSSLRLSLGASYLSHSILSLTEQRGSHHYDPSLRSNQHSFCSRGSHFAIDSIRSNGPSLCARDGHSELGHCDLPYPHHYGHYTHYHHAPLNTDPGLTSNAHSFSSRRDSQLGLGGIKSNPQSFCRASQMEMCFPYQEREVESLKGGVAGGRPRFLLREGDCDLSCCMEEEENLCTGVRYGERSSVCQLLVERVKLYSHSFRKSLKEHSSHPLLDLRFWLLDFAIFFSMLSTLFIFIIYKDFANSKGLGEYYAIALSIMGAGDLCGRMSMGFLLSIERLDSLFIYGLAMFFCGIDIFCHIFISTSKQLITVALLFGVMYGSQNILIAVVPSKVFGREKLPTVFGHILFMGGLGALFGAPLAGYIVDRTGSYDGLMSFSVVCLFLAASLMFSCSLVNRNVKFREQQKKEALQAVKVRCDEE